MEEDLSGYWNTHNIRCKNAAPVCVPSFKGLAEGITLDKQTIQEQSIFHHMEVVQNVSFNVLVFVTNFIDTGYHRTAHTAHNTSPCPAVQKTYQADHHVNQNTH
jgi:hypothetical protein